MLEISMLNFFNLSEGLLHLKQREIIVCHQRICDSRSLVTQTT